MIATCMPRPRFRTEHSVRFTGGEGTVRGAKWEFGQWIYLVEMTLGTEPEFGRIGPEAMVLLDETDLYET
jgi:hypothetical protein